MGNAVLGSMRSSTTSRTKDLTGMTFGYLTLIGVVRTEGSNRVWAAKCVCGNETTVTTTNAVRKRKQSCGCLLLDKLIGHTPTNKLPILERNLRRKLKTYKMNAKLAERLWELKNEEACTMFMQPCAYCGSEPDSEKGNGIDRIDSNQGYISSNCTPACSFCNYAKRIMPTEEFLSWIERVHRHLHRIE